MSYKMKSTTKTIRLKEICDKITKGTTPTTCGMSFVSDGINFIKAESITPSGTINTSTFAKISKNTHERLKRSQLVLNDILFSMAGMFLGKTAILSDEKLLPANTNQAVAIIRVNERIANPFYVSYYLKQKKIIKYINSISGQSAQPNINLNEIGNIEIELPSLETQGSISKILQTLDNKIELNENINQNLEAQAQAIFKSWFVDFEPFKNGKFIDSELGKIPEGWRVKRLGAVCECVLGGTPSRSRKEYWEGNIPWINSGKTNEFRVISPSEFISAEGLKKSATKLLPKKTTILAITGATLGQVSLLEIDACANQSVVGILENNLLPYEYIYMYVSHNIEKIISHQTGGAQQHINKDNIKNFHIILPPQCELKRYTNAVENLYSEITNLVFQSRRLSQLRDTLLPKLMSGEIDVSDVAM